MKYRKTVLDYLVNGTLFYYKGKQYSVFMVALSNCSVEVNRVDCSVEVNRVDCSVEVNRVDCSVEVNRVDCSVEVNRVDCSVDYSVDCSVDYSVEVNMVGSDRLEYLPKSTIVKVRD
jgi:hypothetical protein